MHIETLPIARSESLQWMHEPLLRERVKRLAPVPQHDNGVRLRIGLACPEGTVRQIIHTDSVLEAVHVFETLRDIGYEPVSRAEGALRLDRVYKPSGSALLEERS